MVEGCPHLVQVTNNSEKPVAAAPPGQVHGAPQPFRVKSE